MGTSQQPLPKAKKSDSMIHRETTKQRNSLSWIQECVLGRTFHPVVEDAL
jgi:hypothetical protein